MVYQFRKTWLMKEKSIRQSHTREEATTTPYRNRWGMTPQQIRQNFLKASKQQQVVKQQTRRVTPARQARPSTSQPNRKFNESLRLLLETPANTANNYSIYPCPEWFTSTTKADISVIVPLHKSSLYLKEHIASWDLLNDGLRTEVIYVDDGCPIKSKEAVIANWTARKQELKSPVGRIYSSPEAYGFSVACNAGAYYATGDFLIFLNADTTVTPNWLRPIIRLLKKEGVGIVGNLQFKLGTTDEIDSAGSEWSWESMSFLHIGRDSYRGKRLSKPLKASNCPSDLLEIQEREMVTGACLGISKKLFDDLGGFNPNYRIGYWEDAELCMAVKERGHRIMYQPNSRIFHKGGHSNNGPHKYLRHNQNYFYNKWLNTGRVDNLIEAKRIEPIKEVQNILIHRDAAHGDVLLAAAVAPALKKKWPHAKVMFHTICPEVLEGNPHIDKVIENQEVMDRVFQVYHNLDLVYEMRPKTNILKAYAEAVGVSVADCMPFLYSELPDEELPEDYIVVHAGRTNWIGRNWAPLKFEVLCNKIRKEGMPIVCVGTMSDHKVTCDIDFRGKTTIQELAGIIKNAKFFVGIDSFPMHVAQVFNIPGVAFFGSILPETRIYRDNLVGIVAPSLPCLGCHQRQPAPATSLDMCELGIQECINKVSVADFIEKINEVYSRCTGKNMIAL